METFSYPKDMLYTIREAGAEDLAIWIQELKLFSKNISGLPGDWYLWCISGGFISAVFTAVLPEALV